MSKGKKFTEKGGNIQWTEGQEQRQKRKGNGKRAEQGERRAFIIS